MEEIAGRMDLAHKLQRQTTLKRRNLITAVDLVSTEVELVVAQMWRNSAICSLKRRRIIISQLISWQKMRKINDRFAKLTIPNPQAEESVIIRISSNTSNSIYNRCTSKMTNMVLLKKPSKGEEGIIKDRSKVVTDIFKTRRCRAMKVTVNRKSSRIATGTTTTTRSRVSLICQICDKNQKRSKKRRRHLNKRSKLSFLR